MYREKIIIISHRGDEFEGEQPVTIILDSTHPDQGQHDVHGALHGQWLGAAVEQSAQHLTHRCWLATARQTQAKCHQILAKTSFNWCALILRARAF